MPQLDKATFYLQSTTVFFAFFFLYFFVTVLLIPQMAISLAVRHHLKLEVEENLDKDSFNYFSFLNFGTGVVASFLEINFIIVNNFFFEFKNEIFKNDYAAINSLFFNEVSLYFIKKTQVLNAISKL